jgi:hypothetical protein
MKHYAQRTFVYEVDYDQIKDYLEQQGYVLEDYVDRNNQNITGARVKGTYVVIYFGGK